MFRGTAYILGSVWETFFLWLRPPKFYENIYLSWGTRRFSARCSFCWPCQKEKRKNFNSPLIGPYPGPQSRGFVLTGTRARVLGVLLWCESPVFLCWQPLWGSSSPVLTGDQQPPPIIHCYFGLLLITPYMKFCVLSGIMIGPFSRIGQGFPLNQKAGLPLRISLYRRSCETGLSCRFVTVPKDSVSGWTVSLGWRIWPKAFLYFKQCIKGTL